MASVPSWRTGVWVWGVAALALAGLPSPGAGVSVQVVFRPRWEGGAESHLPKQARRALHYVCEVYG